MVTLFSGSGWRVAKYAEPFFTKPPQKKQSSCSSVAFVMFPLASVCGRISNQIGCASPAAAVSNDPNKDPALYFTDPLIRVSIVSIQPLDVQPGSWASGGSE